VAIRSGVFGPTTSLPWGRTISMTMTRGNDADFLRAVHGAGRLDPASQALYRLLASHCERRGRSRISTYALAVTLGTAADLLLLDDILAWEVPRAWPAGSKARCFGRLRRLLRRATFRPMRDSDVQGPGEAAFLKAVRAEPSDPFHWMGYADWLMEQDDGKGTCGTASRGRTRAAGIADWLRHGQEPIFTTAATTP
jgi:uncharacterized protein (TIGR02996 family)